MGRHVVEVARSRVVIEDGRIVSISEPGTRRCPLRSGLYGIEEESVDSVRKTVEFYISEWGMFTPDRVVRTKSLPVSFGVSEIFACGLRQGLLDAVVLVCEGAGTVISADPEVVEGIGAHMTGLIETSPEPAIISRLAKNRAVTVFPEDARMDQVKGTLKAVEMGYRAVGVTISGQAAREASRVRSAGGERCVIAAVHNTGITREAARQLASSCDLVTGCASRWTREIVAKSAIMQLGLNIPVFVLTPSGKELVLARIRDFPNPLIVGSGDLPLAGRDPPVPLE
jgi:putative methanogenesis marker protein 8